MRKFIFTLVCATMLLSIACSGWCQTPPSQTVDMKAEIQSENSISVAINKVVGTAWTSASSVDFGVLSYDPTNKIFTANCSYVVDVGVNSNAADWDVTHTISKDIMHETITGQNLNKNINVTFVKQNSALPVELGKFSLTDSHNQSYTKAQVGSPNWLRIYYGIATGSGDATGAVPITADKPAGKYSGQIKLTLYVK